MSPHHVGQRPADRHRLGFTLVELLVVLTVVVLLTSALLGAIYAAQEAARATQTRHTIAKLHMHTMFHWATYRTRRLRIAPRGSDPNNPNENYTAFAARRLGLLWQVMQVEMPDHYNEFLRYPPSLSAGSPFAMAHWYRQVVQAAPNPSQVANSNRAAECLYLFITFGARSEDDLPLRSREVGDTDGDGMLEFLDGWGQPIRWLRWAPGFQLPGVSPVPATGAVAEDPFDPLKASRLLQPANNTQWNNTPTGYMIPLIYSVGPDGESGLNDPDSAPGGWPQFNRDWHPLSWFPSAAGSPLPRGAVVDADLAADNIHNYLQQTSEP